MSVFLSPNLPANVVEIGNEISQAKINEINAGTLATQTWVTTGFAPKASPTFTGTVTIPAGASISGYLTTSSASSTYQTISGMSSYATQSYVTSQGYLTDAPSDGSEYVRKNAAWAIATGGGGGGISDAPSDGNLYARQNAAWTSFTIPTLSVTNIDLTGNFNGYSMGSGNYTFKFDSTANTLRMQDSVGSGITISPTSIAWPNGSVQTNAIFPRVVSTITSNYTLANGDQNKIIYVDGTMLQVNIPDDATFIFENGTEFVIVTNNLSSNTLGHLTSGAPLINGSGSGGYALARNVTKLVKVSTDNWFVY